MVVGFHQFYDKQYKSPDQSRIMYSIFFPGSEPVFPEYNIQWPVKAVLYMPVPAYNNGKQFRNGFDAA